MLQFEIATQQEAFREYLRLPKRHPKMIKPQNDFAFFCCQAGKLLSTIAQWQETPSGAEKNQNFVSNE